MTGDRDRVICNLGCEEEVDENQEVGIALVALSDRYNRVWVERIWEEHSGITQRTQKGDRMHIRQV